MNSLNPTRRLSRFLSQTAPFTSLDNLAVAVSERAGFVFSSYSVSIEGDQVIVTGRVAPNLIPSARDELGIYDLTCADWREDFNLDAHVAETNRRLNDALDLPGVSYGIAHEAKALLLNRGLRVHADDSYAAAHLTVLVLVESWTVESARAAFNEVLSAEYADTPIAGGSDHIVFIGTHPLASEGLQRAARKAAWIRSVRESAGSLTAVA